MNIDSHIENATRAIHNAKIVRNTSKKTPSKNNEATVRNAAEDNQ